ncbi:hypothetical protein J2T57_000504 [Natronocella acetinitrilica]|uniref:DUF1468 domain-containing protein n=1 Tax=Natronocella acetinitrilica TaxID=414046 RepID=A0AAE3G0Z2_9GAMM|nr:tripartite tricarboxylate transporter TctB family protein [Natronocella acetinitrilica]MCP1673412.1 hypothetical protein [Natronocella acetinitrilica]
MSKYVADIVFAVALLIGSVYLWFVADALPRFARYQYVDSDFWPKALLVLIGLLALGILYQNVQRLLLYRRQQQMEEKPEVSLSEDTSYFNWGKFLLAAVLTVGYFIALRYTGFLIATAVFMSIAVHITPYQRWWLKVVFPFVFTALVALLFVLVLSLPLPRGVGAFYQFNLFFY